MDYLILDAEIKHGVITDNNPPSPGYVYAKGWNDYVGMGIACVCAFDTGTNRYRVFTETGLDDLQALIDRRTLVTFNGTRFDLPLLGCHGIATDLNPAGGPIPHHDLATLIWQAAGIPPGEHPKGLGLDALCRANGLPGKTGHAASAPQDWQDGHYGRVIDYCLADVENTLRLWDLVTLNGGCRDPRTGEWLNVAALPELLAILTALVEERQPLGIERDEYQTAIALHEKLLGDVQNGQGKPTADGVSPADGRP